MLFPLPSRHGMALVVVLAFSSVLLILGSAYLKTFRQGTTVSQKQLEQIQSEYFAQGIQRIAMLKFKRFSPHFYRAYRYQMAKERGETLTNNYSPTPLEYFHGIGANVLQNSTDSAFKAPLNIESYSTRFTMVKINEFNRDVLQITVNVKLQGIPTEFTFRTSVDASRTAILGGS